MATLEHYQQRDLEQWIQERQRQGIIPTKKEQDLYLYLRFSKVSPLEEENYAALLQMPQARQWVQDTSLPVLKRVASLGVFYYRTLTLEELQLVAARAGKKPVGQTRQALMEEAVQQGWRKTVVKDYVRPYCDAEVELLQAFFQQPCPADLPTAWEQDFNEDSPLQVLKTVSTCLQHSTLLLLHEKMQDDAGLLQLLTDVHETQVKAMGGILNVEWKQVDRALLLYSRHPEWQHFPVSWWWPLATNPTPEQR